MRGPSLNPTAFADAPADDAAPDDEPSEFNETLTSLAAKDQTKVSFDFNDLGLKLNTNGMQVLAGVTGQLPAGSVTAIMGPSGAGKTTFINTLSGKATYGRITGRVMINGRVQSIERFSNLIGFVPQVSVRPRSSFEWKKTKGQARCYELQA